MDERQSGSGQSGGGLSDACKFSDRKVVIRNEVLTCLLWKRDPRRKYSPSGEEDYIPGYTNGLHHSGWKTRLFRMKIKINDETIVTRLQVHMGAYWILAYGHISSL
jgi:hypothetical protein